MDHFTAGNLHSHATVVASVLGVTQLNPQRLVNVEPFLMRMQGKERK